MILPVTTDHWMDDRAASPAPDVELKLLRYFQRHAPFQPATNFWRSIELPVLAAALPLSGLGLDVGCGDGVLTRILRDLLGADWRLVGLDPDPAETVLAQQTNLYERLHTGGADRIPETEATFDFAFANSVLEHIPDLSPCLAEIARCLKPGGLFAATVPSPHLHDCLAGPGWTRCISRQDYLRETDQRLAHFQYWSAERWRHELEATGFTVEEIAPYLSRSQIARWEFWANWTGGLLYRLQRGRRQPIAIQRALGMRRGLPRPLHLFAPMMARLLSCGLADDRTPAPEFNGCFLIKARRVRR